MVAIYWIALNHVFVLLGLWQVQGMAEDIGPLLKEVREGGLLKELEQLTKVATESGRDLG
jgi:hypothetical protein